MRHIAIAIPLVQRFGRDVVRGIAEYAHRHLRGSAAWVLHPLTPMPHAALVRLDDLPELDGVIVHPARVREMLDDVGGHGQLYREIWHGTGVAGSLPAVAVASPLTEREAPRVHSDEALVGAAGAEHLLSTGFRHFCFLGHAPGQPDQGRRDGFEAVVRRTPGRHVVRPPDTVGIDPVQDGGYRRQATAQEQRLAEWLATVPRPIAVMAFNDYDARHLIGIAAASGLRIPEEMAVLGVDNDDVHCVLTTPPLSSVPQDAVRIGMEAGRLLAARLAGREAEPEVAVPPLPVMARRSTDIAALADEEVAQVLRHVRDHACEAEADLRLAEVAEQFAMAPRTLHRRFQTQIGRTLQQEVARLRVDHASSLLLDTDLPLEQIAHASGFASVSYFHQQFRRHAGVTPAHYRRTRRLPQLTA